MRVPIRSQVMCISDQRISRGVTWNISRSGIRIEVSELPTKANVQLTFRLPLSDTIIEARGAVVWASGRLHGIKFKRVGEQSDQSIQHFIKDRSG